MTSVFWRIAGKITATTFTATFAALVAASPLMAQQPINSIEVLVNDEPISTFDINQRLRLVVALSGGIRTEEEFLKVREQVIRSMIDERLQMQEAAELELSVSDSETDGFFVRRAESVGQTAEQFESALNGIGTSKKTMTDQMAAEIAWSQLVQGRMGAFVSVSDDEVEAQIERIKSNKGKFEYRLAEIVLQLENQSQDANVRATAEQLVERIQGGASFPEIAQQLSASPTAAVGGDLGWITADDLSSAQAEAVEQLPVGQISNPIRTPGGYTILAVRDRRRVLTADPLDTQVSLRQLYLPQASLENEETVAKYETAVAALRNEEGNSCGRIATYVEESGADANVELGIVRLRDLAPDLRSALQTLEIGRPSEVLKQEDGWRLLFVCDRQEAAVQEPNFDEIYTQIEQQRLAMMGRRYLRDLRRDAIIDYR